MDDTEVPSFGDISSILVEGNSIRENLTILQESDSEGTYYDDANKDGYETTSEKSPSTSDISFEEDMEVETQEGKGSLEDSELTDVDTPSQVLRTGELQDSIEASDLEDDEQDKDGDEEVESDSPIGGVDDEVGEGSEEEESREAIFQLPITKIKRIMKADPDGMLFSKEALVAVAITTENFVAMLAQQCYKVASRTKKKRITLEHLKSVVTSNEACDFLDGAMPEFDFSI